MRFGGSCHNFLTISYNIIHKRSSGPSSGRLHKLSLITLTVTVYQQQKYALASGGADGPALTVAELISALILGRFTFRKT